MARLNARSVKSRQNAVLRYIASTDLDTAASHFGISTQTLRNFVNATPKRILEVQDHYQKPLSLSPSEIAKARNVRLVPRLSGHRLSQAYRHQNMPEYKTPKGRTVRVDTDWLTRSIRYAQATRTHYQWKDPRTHKIEYREIAPYSRKEIFAKRQILSGLQNENTRSLVSKYKTGRMSRSESLRNIRLLWKNSDQAFTPEMEAKWYGD